MRHGALLLALALLLLLAACGNSHTNSVKANAADVRAALEDRLLARKLSYRWIVCVRTKRSFAGNPIFRCNVNFGEPHIVRYCATLQDGQFVTNREQPAMHCGRDAAS
ncbi:MAG: hypothetical protein WD015_03955 [Gaiellaceae bacterium]